MKLDRIEKNSKDISKSLIKILECQIPTDKITTQLEDIVLLLTYELLNGNLNIDIEEYNPPIQIKSKNWPIDHIKSLNENGWINTSFAPIVLKKNKLSWKRWHDEMTTAIDILIKRSRLNSTKKNSHIAKSLLPSTNHLNKEQQTAVNTILNQGVILLSGGPGTGKTSTIIHMLQQVLEVYPSLNIGLAAPTGKATKRLQDSMLSNSIKLEDINHKNKISKIPCKTIHSWLNASLHGFGKNKSSPLSLDLLVIDEMSMVNLSLMQAILEALPIETKLILVGDPNQLAPIGSGSIWQELQQTDILQEFGRGAIHLTKVYRNRGEIASLSKVIKENNFKLFWEKVSNQPQQSNVQLHLGDLRNIPSTILKELDKQRIEIKALVKDFKRELSDISRVSSTTQIQASKINTQIFQSLDELMVLSPKKSGWWGVNHVNRTLLGKSFEEGVMRWPEGTPIICTENQHDLGLSNGDIGLIIGEYEHRRFLFRIFSSERNVIFFLIHPARVKNIEPAFALTIHKAQGSESNKVILLWPETIDKATEKNKQNQSQETMNKRLLYTAITRAKEKLLLNIPKNSS